MPRRLKIVHISTTASGAPWMVALMREQKRLGHDVSAIVTGLTPDVLPELDDPTIQFHRCQAALLSLRGIGARLRALLALARLLRRLRPDVVHSHVLEAVVASRLASWIADVPRHFGGNVAPISVESPLLRPLELGTAFCDAVTIASCTHTRDLFLRHGLPAEKVALIHYAVDQSSHDPASADGDRVRRELGIPLDAPVVGKMAYFYPPATAALFPQWAGRGLKGHDVLIRAVPHVLRAIPQVRFVIVGCGRGAKGELYWGQMRELARSMGVADAVIFTGERTDVPDTLAMFDVSVHCSLTDNLGGTVESLLMARPMVVSDIPGFADAVRHDETGLIVPPDDPEALAASIVRLLRDRALGRRLGERGRQLMLQRFSLARAVAETEELLARTDVPSDGFYRRSRLVARAAAAPFRLLPILWAVKRRHLAALRH